ncbi:MAG: PHP domain-containing protein [Treponema sp.]|jgi:predicted metal-dependent phosphoesterase TrpH|nr:PHP domain-containing protein [Treponema sp.]
MIDLHTHSTASDGSLSPTALVHAAAEQDITVLALTDHDTLAGVSEAEQAAKQKDIRFIPGIEIEISWEPGEFHLLGLDVSKPSPAFTETITELAQKRQARNLAIIERMQEAGITVQYEDILTLSGGHSVGRPHFASFLVNQHIVKNHEQAFEKYLAKGKPFYVPREGLDFQRALTLIKESGGITVLAHPMSLYVSWGKLPSLIRNFQEQGLDGIEAWHPAATPRVCKRLEELGRLLNMYITAGSDFHGANRPDRKLGITSGGRNISEAFLEAIPPLAEGALRAASPYQV